MRGRARPPAPLAVWSGGQTGTSFEENARLASVVESSDDAIMTVALDGTVLSWNGGAEKLYGYTAEEFVGHNVSELAPPDRLGEAPPVLEKVRRGEGVDRYETECIVKDGQRRAVSLTVSPIWGPSGGVVSAAAIVRDVTEGRRTAEKLRRSETRLAMAQRVAGLGTWEYDAAGNEAWWSEELYRIYGFDPEEVTPSLGKLMDLVHPEDVETVGGYASSLPSEGERDGIEHRIVRPDGEVRFVQNLRAVEHDGSGRPTKVIGTVQDVTERKRVEEEARKLARHNRQLFDVNPDALVSAASDGTILDANPAMSDLTGLSRKKLVGRSLLDHLPEGTAERCLELIRNQGYIRDFPLEVRRTDGRLTPALFNAAAYRDATGESEGFLASIRDMTERVALERRLEHQALHDPLTGLPNRALFRDRLDHALQRSERSGRKCAVLFLDLDNFKYVNDSLGHEAGDRLLVEVGRRLSRSLRAGDTAARLGGDEFVVLLEEIEDEAEAAAVALRVAEGLETPFSLARQEVFVTASLGLAVGGRRGDGPEDLLSSADIAMYAAKREGKNRHVLFHPSMNESAQARLGVESDLRRAAADPGKEFFLLYQPTISAWGETKGGVSGFEALLRWQHPEKGTVRPEDFLRVAEETGTIVPIGRWVIEEACRQAKEWQGHDERGRSAPRLKVSVNLSARQLASPGLVGDVRRALDDSGLDPAALVLEITESAVIEDPEDAASTMKALKALGVNLALDGFGTGYSSLSYLERFPVDVLKIDRSFVAKIGRDAEGTALLSAVADLARVLGLEVIAEGVETAEQQELLQEVGCDLLQGYYFSEPLSEADATVLLTAAVQ